MIAAVRGRLEWMGTDSVLVEVGGVSLQLFVPTVLLNEIGNIGSEIKLYTHLYVREDQLALYGFKNPDDLSLFEMLLGVAGIGPRAALAALGTASSEDVQLAIAQGDVDFLKRVPGIGAKTASRIILELKGKLVEAKASAKSSPALKTSTALLEQVQITEALTNLGYTVAEVQTALAALPIDSNLSLEERVLAALRYLGQ